MFLLFSALLAAQTLDVRQEAQRFLDLYNSLYVGQYRISAEAAWTAATDVSDASEAGRVAADQAYATFVGDAQVIATTRRLLESKSQLDPLQVRQLEAILFEASAWPSTIPDIVSARVEAEAHQAGILDGYVFCFEARSADGSCPSPKVANDIDDVLLSSNDLDERLKVWNASKEIGRDLKPGLAELRDLRNQLAREMGYSSYFGLMVSEYGMTVDEMMALLDQLIVDMQPLHTELHKWTRRKLARRYGQAEPTGNIPAHWVPNRWAQEFPGLVPAAEINGSFASWTPERIVKQAEAFYTSMGFAPLPPAFWEGSDLYPVPEGDDRKKNAHASAWHMDLNQDVRSLMSVEPNAQWFFTSHHELGHIYYDLSYARPEVPPVLREGANRGFHEGIGELISLAASQTPYLQAQGILPAKTKVDANQALLNEALEMTVMFIPFAAGTMARFEYELYEKNLPPDQWQKRWWELVQQYQKVDPPSMDRLTDPNLCDACTKTHINDDPAGYYDYALATILKYQLHQHIATELLDQDPHACNYYGQKQVGDFLKGILAQGATEDWRVVLKNATGSELTTRPMVDYYQPLYQWLVRENRKGR